MVTINRYIIKMYQEGDEDCSRSMNSFGENEEEAIRKIINDPWWYKEDEGFQVSSLKYPLTFKAELNNE